MSDAATVEVRDRRGEWQPDRFIETPPVFVWPPRPAGFLKWLFGFPGYLWPWNALYVAIATATWLWLTPDFARMQHLHADWIALILLRNVALLCGVVGVWHLWLYTRKAQGTQYKYSNRWLADDNPTFLFRSQLADNMIWTLGSAVPIWTAYEVVTLWLQAKGVLPTVSFRAHPIYCMALMLFIPLFREVHFYCIHRLIHWPPLYRTVHHLHHNNVNVGPWSGMAMHPVEHVLYFSGVLLHWIVPSHPLHVIFHLQHLSFAPSQGHSGFERVVLADGVAVPTGNFMHYLHHKYFEVNYGGDGLVPIDKWCGTFHDGSEAAQERMNRRVLGRKASAGAA